MAGKFWIGVSKDVLHLRHSCTYSVVEYGVKLTLFIKGAQQRFYILQLQNVQNSQQPRTFASKGFNNLTLADSIEYNCGNIATKWRIRGT